MALLRSSSVNASSEAPFPTSAEAATSTTSILDLPKEIMEYIFSFLDFVQRFRVEEVCRSWRQVQTQLTLGRSLSQNCTLNDSVACAILSRRGPSLEKLVVKSNTELTCEFIGRIGYFCPNLVDLELHLIGQDQIICLTALASGCSKLKVLKVDNHDKTPSPRGVPAEAYGMTYWKNFNKICSDGMLALAQSCQALECLSVSNLPCIPLKWLEVISPNLRTLCLSDAEFTSEAMRCLMRRCSTLQELSLDDWTQLDQTTVLDFFKQYRRTLRIIRKKSLFLDSVDEEWREGLQLLNNLEILQLSSYHIVDDALMKVLAENCRKLRSLDIGYSPRVTDLGLMSLRNLPCLTELTIGQNSGVDGYGLELLVGKGILQQVTVSSSNYKLQAVCNNTGVLRPALHIEKKVEWCLQQDENEVDEGEEKAAKGKTHEMYNIKP